MNPMHELGSTYSRLMIESLLSVHALTNMYRVNGDRETRRRASEWLPILEKQLAALKYELTKEGEE